MVAKKISEMDEFDLYWRWSENLARSTDDLTYLLQNQRMFRDVLRMFEKNERLGGIHSPVFQWIWRLWGTEAVMFIRREMDDQAGVINLKHTLYEMESRPEVLNRERFIDTVMLDRDCCDFEARDRAYAQFDTFPIVKRDGCPYQDYIDPTVIATDRKQLERDTEEAYRFAQTYIAHRTPLDPDLYGGSIDRAVDAIRRTLGKYNLIIDAEPMKMRVRLPNGWSKTFALPWNPKK